MRRRCTWFDARRRALAVVAATLALAPQGGLAQRRPPTIGWLITYSPDLLASYAAALDERLRERGWRPGVDLMIERRFTEGDPARYEEMAAALVGAGVDVILVSTDITALAARHATSTIPIVMTGASNPVGFGLIESLAHPGRNVTGLMFDPGPELNAKTLQYLREVRPGLARVAVLRNANRGWEHLEHTAMETARSMGLALVFVDLPLTGELDASFAAMKAAHVDGLLFWTANRTSAWTARVARRALEERLPSASQNLLYAHDGGLISYGPDYVDNFRRAAGYIDKILRGSSPEDLPMELPSRLELAINRRAARALGIELPTSLLLRADRVFD